MKLLEDIRSTIAIAKLHWYSRRAKNWCAECKHQWSESDCPFDFVRKNTYARINLCEKFEERPDHG